MGFYKLYRIIKDFLKKPFRTAFIFIIIVIIISFFSSSAFAVETVIEHPYQKDGFYSQDPTVLIKTYYDNLSYHSIKFFSSSDIVNSSDFKHLLNYVVNQKQTYYIRSLTSVTYRFYAFYNDSPYSYIDTHFGIGDFVTVPTQESEMRYNFYYDFGYDNQTRKYFINRVNVTSPNNSIYIPSCLVLYQNSDLQNYFNSLVNNDTKTIINILNGIDSKIQETNDKIDEVTNFLKDDTKDDSAISTLPGNSSSSDDPTESGFNSIFESFKSAFTENSYQEFEIKIPFTNKSFYLVSNFLSKYASKWNFVPGVTFLDFINMFWYFVFSLYIVKDVEKIVEKIKNGDIATSSDTNIKTDML